MSVPSHRIEVRGPEDGVKICGKCGDRKPASAFYFDKDRTADDGWYPYCKECRKQMRQDKENRQIAKAIVGSESKLLSMLAQGDFHQVMCDVVSGGETVLRAFGGIEGLAQKLAMDYESSPIGTPSRTKLLLGVLSFVTKAMEAQEPVNVSTLDDETLRNKLIEALGHDRGRRITDQSEDRSPVGDSESD